MGKLKFGSKSNNFMQGYPKHQTSAVNYGSALHNNGNNDNDEDRGSNVRTDKWNPPVVETGKWVPGDDNTEKRDITTTQTGTGTTVIKGKPVEKIVKPGEPGYEEWLAAVTKDPTIEDKYKDKTIVEDLNRENVETETRVIPETNIETKDDDDDDSHSETYKMREWPITRKVVTKKPGMFTRGKQELSQENVAIGDIHQLDKDDKYTEYYDFGSDEKKGHGDVTSNVIRTASDEIILNPEDVPKGRTQANVLRSGFGRGWTKFANIFRKHDKPVHFVPGMSTMGTGPSMFEGGTEYINPETIGGGGTTTTGYWDPNQQKVIIDEDDKNNNITDDTETTR